MSFDRLAPHYHWMEYVLAGGKLQRCRLAWLKIVRDCHNVLLVGEGPGRFLQSCAHELPEARIVCVDASGAMLKRARSAWRRADGDAGRVEFVQAWLPEWQPPEATIDLIVTHFFLDCFPEALLARVVASLAAAAKPDACWLVSDFQIPAAGLPRLRAQVVLALAYAFFRITTHLPARTLVSPDVFLEHEDFQLLSRLNFDGQLLHADLWARGKAIRVCGAEADRNSRLKHKPQGWILNPT